MPEVSVFQKKLFVTEKITVRTKLFNHQKTKRRINEDFANKF